MSMICKLLFLRNENYEDPDYGSKVMIQMDSLPNERFKRNVVRTRLDLIGKQYLLSNTCYPFHRIH